MSNVFTKKQKFLKKIYTKNFFLRKSYKTDKKDFTHFRKQIGRREVKSRKLQRKPTFPFRPVFIKGQNTKKIRAQQSFAGRDKSKFYIEFSFSQFSVPTLETAMRARSPYFATLLLFFILFSAFSRACFTKTETSSNSISSTSPIFFKNSLSATIFTR